MKKQISVKHIPNDTIYDCLKFDRHKEKLSQYIHTEFKYPLKSSRRTPTKIIITISPGKDLCISGAE